MTTPAIAVRHVPVLLHLFRRSKSASVLTRPANLRARWCRAAQELTSVLVCLCLSVARIRSLRRWITRRPNTRMTHTRRSIVIARFSASSITRELVGLLPIETTRIMPSIMMTLGKKDTISVRGDLSVCLLPYRREKQVIIIFMTRPASATAIRYLGCR